MRLEIEDLRGRSAADALRPARPEIPAEVVEAVRAILRRVRDEGDVALVDLTRRFDGADLSEAGLVATAGEVEAAAGGLEPGLREAVDAMIERLLDLHARQVPASWVDETDGVRFGEVVRPVDRAGCYVPGGRAAYPSTVAMTVVPARVAGVEDVTVTTPPRADGSVPPAVLYAAQRAGATRVVKAGGAQAVAAMAYGTASVPAVDVIVGPGNVYVTAAKREVAGEVGIDGLAGPTELVVVLDGSADPRFVAADLVAQAEHDPLALATVVATDEPAARRVLEALEAEAAAAERGEIVAQALARARVLVVEGLDQAAAAVNALAAEHLQVVVADPAAFLALVRSAGAVFVGPWTPVPFGDYGVGSNHVLPTMGTARFASGLRATNFVRVSAVVELDAAAAARLAPGVALVARSEGLAGHARAVEVRAEAAGGSA